MGKCQDYYSHTFRWITINQLYYILYIIRTRAIQNRTRIQRRYAHYYCIRYIILPEVAFTDNRTKYVCRIGALYGHLCFIHFDETTHMSGYNIILYFICYVGRRDDRFQNNLTHLSYLRIAILFWLKPVSIENVNIVGTYVHNIEDAYIICNFVERALLLLLLLLCDQQ